jgi:glycosyl transferase family 92
VVEGDSRAGAWPDGGKPLLVPDLQTGFFEELDKSSVPWRGRGTFRLQVHQRRIISERVFSREETEAIAAAARETPQEIRMEGRGLRWWVYDGTWYTARRDLLPDDVEACVAELYRKQLNDWGVQSIASPPPLEPPRDHRQTYLAACAIFFNEAPYLPEWIEFHLLAGVERFFLYDHESTDSSRDVLAPYVEDGTVEVHDWPIQPGQQEAFEDCAERHRFDCRWIAFIDIDEFLFSAVGPLPEALRDFEQWPGVVVNRPTYGSSGHETRPPGLAIESYLLRSNVGRRSVISKTVARPEFLVGCPHLHNWDYTEGHAVDELRRPAPFAKGLSSSFETVRLNHYWTRSRHECEGKLATPTAVQETFRTWTFEGIDAGLNDVTDAAAAAYAPAVKDALRRRRLWTDAPSLH